MSKMNKKLPALFLALVLVLGMTACGGKAIWKGAHEGQASKLAVHASHASKT